MSQRLLTLSLLAVACAESAVAQTAIRRLSGFTQNNIPANDDGSSRLMPLPFTINFFGRIRNSVYVNNNGNITFDAALATYTPFGLESTRREIIAPFFADVDTRNPDSRLVTFGSDRVDGRLAFGVNYIDVGYFATHADRLNSFQLILIDRSDTGAGNFDVEFNYERIQWETGDASGGTGGLGGVPVVAGWSNGSGNAGTSFEMEGSMVSGAFLDNGPRSLTRRRLNSPVLGRFVFRARDGVLSQGLGITSSAILPRGVVGIPYQGLFTADGGSNPYRWALLNDPGMTLPGLSMNTQGVLSGTPTARGVYEFTVSVTSRVDGNEETASQRVSVVIDAPSLMVDQRSCPMPDALAGSNYSHTLRAAGGPGPFLWSWGEDGIAPVPGLTLAENGAITGTPARAGSYNFLIRVAGPPASEARPATRACTLIVRAPATTPAIFGCPQEQVTATVPYQAKALASGGAAPWRWTAFGALPTGITMDASGVLSGIATVPGEYPYALQARDITGNTVQTDCKLSVQSPAVRVDTACPLPPTETGSPYSFSLSATGGEGPFAWELSGSLPSGLRLSTDGRISGSANDAGSWRFLLIATDRAGRQVGKQCSLIVNRSALSISACPLPDARLGTLYSQELSTVGGVAPLRWAHSGTLPAGLLLSTSGRIYGTPTAPGDYTIPLRVSDAGGNTTTQQCRLYVQPDPLRIERPCPLSDARMGIFYREYALAEGGIQPYSWRNEGKLPPGVSLSSAGVFTGVPSLPGEYPFTLLLEDQRGAQLRKTCRINSKLPALPDIRLAADRNVTTNIPVDINLSSTYPLALSGDLVISSEAQTGASEGSVNRPDPAVQIMPAGRRVSFTIPPGTRSLRFRVASLGTVAAQHTLRIERLNVAGIEQAVSPAPITLDLPRSAPTLSDACYTQAFGVLQIRLTGQTRTRELTSLNLELNGKAIVDTPISTVAFDYFSNPLSIRTGGTFQIDVPVLVDRAGLDVQVTSLTASVGNAVGASAVRNVRRCN